MFANFSFPAMAKTKLEPAAAVHAPPKSLLLLLLLQVASCRCECVLLADASAAIRRQMCNSHEPGSQADKNTIQPWQRAQP